MNKLIVIIFSLIAVFMISCNQKQKQYELIKTEGQMVFNLNKPSPSAFYPIFYNHQLTNQNHIIYGFNGQDTCIDFLDFKLNKISKISIANTLKRIGYNEKMGLFLYFETDKLVWIDSGVSDSIYSVNIASDEVVSVISKDIDNDFSIYDLMDQIYINSEKNELIMRIYKQGNYATFGYFNINGDKLELKKQLGVLPADYQQKDMYLKSGELTMLNEDSLIISYNYSDSVDLYVNKNLVSRICLKSDSSIIFTGFEGDKMDMNAIRKYFMMKQRYNQLFYDKKNSLYYRVFSYEKKLIGKIEESEKWSICVFNSNFEKIHEQEFNNKDYYKGYITLINSDLYIANSNKSKFGGLKDSTNLVFDGFKSHEISN